jgi:hypothetical protein
MYFSTLSYTLLRKIESLKLKKLKYFPLLKLEFIDAQLLDEREFKEVMKRVGKANPTDICAYAANKFLY